MGRVARYGGALLIVTIAYTLFEQIGVLLIGAIIGTKAVGIFEAPMRLTLFLSYGGQAVAYGVAPRLARKGDAQPDARAFVRAIRYLLILQGALLAPLLIWAEPIADIALGTGYEESVDVLRALAPFMFLLGIGTFITLAVNYVGEAKQRMPWLSIATLAICAALDLVLLPTIGVVGAAISMDVAFTGYVLGHFWICKRVFDFSVRRLVLTLVRCLAAAGAMAGALALIGTSSLTWAEWLTGAFVGGLAYLFVLIATGEISRAEIRAAIDQSPWKPAWLRAKGGGTAVRSVQAGAWTALRRLAASFSSGLRPPGAGGPQAAHERRDLRLEAAQVVAVVHAHPGPPQRVAGVHPARQRARGPIARPPRHLDHTRIVVAVGVCDRFAGAPEALLADGLRPPQLVLEDRVLQLGEMRVRAGVGADLPASCGEAVQLLPGHRHQLTVELAARPVVDSRPRHRALGAGEVGRHEYRRGPPEARQDRLAELEHGAVGVVERDRHRLALRGALHRVGEGGASVPSVRPAGRAAPPGFRA